MMQLKTLLLYQQNVYKWKENEIQAKKKKKTEKCWLRTTEKEEEDIDKAQ